MLRIGKWFALHAFWDELMVPGIDSTNNHKSREDAARELVQKVLLAPELLHDPSVTSFVADGKYARKSWGSWELALDGLVERLSRLEQLEDNFDRTLLTEKLESMRELAYGASHEINNPLANISSRAQTLLRDETDPERRRKLATINSQAFRAHEMIADMMLFAKPPDLVRENVNLSDLIAQVLEELSGRADEQGTALLVTGTSDDCWLSADATHLSVALRALCRNSLEAIGAGGQVTVSLVAAEDSVELSVTDTGPGIPMEVRKHLFDPFYSGREAGRGLGFGLSKCWRIVELHGGSIEVGENTNEYTRFTIRLPRRIEQPKQSSPPLVA
ncbi:MAG: HAMP domain-containing histidine kinase [Planctomycetaceae bacterium]|nr:HAMP domain-containing histidine kinase [Planctomycetales bacterium]MCB9940482.1 HAMP domain-containing histidine kinase [Planctomycetaceae bacterium]